MKIGILGTGTVGQTLAGKLTELGHEVMIGTRSIQDTLKRTAGDNYGGPPFSVWHARNNKVKLGTMAEAAAFGDLIINATHGGSSLHAMSQAGEENLRKKVLLDLSNPLDFSKGMPPILIPELCNTTSLGEEIQKSYPATRVVKALNTMWCGLMINPGMVNHGDHDVFVCGNDESAKTQVITLLKQFGWQPKNINDLGDITASRGMEMLLPFWLKIMGKKGNGAFNLSIVQ